MWWFQFMAQTWTLANELSFIDRGKKWWGCWRVASAKSWVKSQGAMGRVESQIPSHKSQRLSLASILSHGVIDLWSDCGRDLGGLRPLFEMRGTETRTSSPRICLRRDSVSVLFHLTQSLKHAHRYWSSLSTPSSRNTKYGIKWFEKRFLRTVKNTFKRSRRVHYKEFNALLPIALYFHREILYLQTQHRIVDRIECMTIYSDIPNFLGSLAFLPQY